MNAQQAVDRMMPEAEVQRVIEDALKAHGWWYFHDPDVQRCRNCGHVQPDGRKAGLPDILAQRGAILLGLELKRERGTVSAEQADVLRRLNDTKYVFAWDVRPSNLDQTLATIAKARR